MSVNFNLHVDEPGDPAASLCSVLYVFGLTRNARESTYTHGHTLDLVISRSNETGAVFDTSVFD